MPLHTRGIGLDADALLQDVLVSRPVESRDVIVKGVDKRANVESRGPVAGTDYPPCRAQLSENRLVGTEVGIVVRVSGVPEFLLLIGEMGRMGIDDDLQEIGQLVGIRSGGDG